MTGWRKNFAFRITGTYLYIEWAEKGNDCCTMIEICHPVSFKLFWNEMPLSFNQQTI